MNIKNGLDVSSNGCALGNCAREPASFCSACCLHFCWLHTYFCESGKAKCPRCGESAAVYGGQIPPLELTGVVPVPKRAKGHCVVAVHALHTCGAIRHAIELGRVFRQYDIEVVCIAANGGGHWAERVIRAMDRTIVLWRWQLGDAVSLQSEYHRAPLFVSVHHLPTIAWAVDSFPAKAAIIGHVHTMARESRLNRGTLQRFIERCRRLVFPTQVCLDEYASLLDPPSRRRFEAIASVLPNVPAPTFVANRRSKGTFDAFGTRGRRIAVVSRIDADKISMDLFVETVSLLCARDASLRVLVAGFGESSSALQRRTEVAGLGHRCLFTGHIEDIEEVYLWADVVFLPSEYEVMPYVALEANAMGIPCISPDFGYRKELADVGAANVRFFAGGPVKAAEVIFETLEEASRDGCSRVEVARNSDGTGQRTIWEQAVLKVYGDVLNGAAK